MDHPPSRVARQLAKSNGQVNKRLYRKWYGRIKVFAAQDEALQLWLGLQARGDMVLSLPGVTEALVRKARAGRVDAIKLLYEASQFHNPRTTVDHTGEVKITVSTMPRPEVVEDIVDAQVVE